MQLEKNWRVQGLCVEHTEPAPGPVGPSRDLAGSKKSNLAAKRRLAHMSHWKGFLHGLSHSSQSKSRRFGMDVSCQIPPSELGWTTTLQAHLTYLVFRFETTQKERNSGHVFVSSSFSFRAPRDCHCVGRTVVLCWLSCAESSFKCLCASFWQSRSVLEKSASVTVFTCFSSASAFSRVSFTVSLNLVSAAEASSHFCSKRRVASSCRSRAWVRASMASSAASPFVFDVDFAQSVFCKRLWK